MSIDPDLITREAATDYLIALIEYRNSLVADPNEKQRIPSLTELNRMGNSSLVTMIKWAVGDIKKLHSQDRGFGELTDDDKEEIRKCFTYELPSVPFPVKD